MAADSNQPYCFVMVAEAGVAQMNAKHITIKLSKCFFIIGCSLVLVVNY